MVIAGEELPRYEHLLRVQERLAGYGLPLGWSGESAAPAQGSGFWFDLLKKVVNMRAGGTKPDEAESARKPRAEPTDR